MSGRPQALAAPGYLWDLITTPEIRPANFAHIRIDGGLIGGASLTPEDFLKIIASAL